MNSDSTVTPRYTADVTVSPAGSVATTSATTCMMVKKNANLKNWV